MQESIKITSQRRMRPGDIYSMEIVAVPVEGGICVLNVKFPMAGDLSLDELKLVFAELCRKLWDTEDDRHTLGRCFNHPDEPAVTYLDNEWVCQKCSDNWVKGESEREA